MFVLRLEVEFEVNELFCVEFKVVLEIVAFEL